MIFLYIMYRNVPPGDPFLYVYGFCGIDRSIPGGRHSTINRSVPFTGCHSAKRPFAAQRSQVFGEVNDPFQEQRGLHDLFRWDPSDSKQSGSRISIKEGKEVQGCLSPIQGTADGIYMRKNEVDRILREIIKGRPFWDNVTKQGMVLLNEGFL